MQSMQPGVGGGEEIRADDRDERDADDQKQPGDGEREAAVHDQALEEPAVCVLEPKEGTVARIIEAPRPARRPAAFRGSVLGRGRHLAAFRRDGPHGGVDRLSREQHARQRLDERAGQHVGGQHRDDDGH